MKSKKKLKLKKYPNGGKAPIKGTKEQYQAYQDSLESYNSAEHYNKAIRVLAKKFPNLSDEDFLKIRKQVDSELSKKYPRGDMNLVISDGNPIYDGLQSKSYSQGLYNYKPPVQPIIYKPEGFNQISARNQGVNRQDNLGLWNQTQRLNPLDLLQRPKEQYIDEYHYQSQPLESKNNLEFNPIPFKPGSYFTRKKQGQEIGAELEYFDKTIGKKLELGGQINELDMAKNGKWIQKAVNPEHKGYCTPMTKETCTPKRKALAKTFKKMAKNRKDFGGYSDEDPMFNIGDEGYMNPTLQQTANLLGTTLPTNDSIDNTSYSDNLRMSTNFMPLKKGNITTPNITQAPNFKQTIETP